MDKRHSPASDTERLADFTDRLLAGEKPEETAAAPGEQRLTDLQTMVRSIRRSLSPRRPDAVLQNRIRVRLAAEWKAAGPGARPGTGTWRSARQVRRLFAVWTAGIVVALVLVSLFTARWLPVEVSGTAQTLGGILAIVLALMLVVVFVFWRYKKK